LDQNDHELGGN